MGESGEPFRDHVVTVFERHAPGFDPEGIRIRDSRDGNYQSLTIIIIATGEPQLQALFEDLKTNPLVKMVL